VEQANGLSTRSLHINAGHLPQDPGLLCTNEDSQSTSLKMAGLYGAAPLAINGYEGTLNCMASKIYRVSPGIGQHLGANQILQNNSSSKNK
jgi:hypothetical protein